MKKQIVVILFLCMFLVGCDGKAEQEENEDKESNQIIQIGMTFDTFVVERWQRDRDIFVSTAKEYGAEVTVQNANGEVDKQISQMDYFIEKRMDVIVIIPIDSKALTPSIQKAKDKGIKILSYDRLALDANVDLYLSFDNEEVGHLMGEALNQVLQPQDQVLMICGPTSDNNVQHVEQGFRMMMEQNQIQIVDVAYAQGWKAEFAGEYILEHLDTVKQVKAIMCGNDNLASYALLALSENRLAGKIYVVGQDADLEACQKIVEGTQYMTVYKSVETLAKEAASYAVMLAKDEVISNAGTISDGTYLVPYIGLEPVAVFQDNMDEVVIDSGFHLREDVYRNCPQTR